jgi:hypothetical protein
MALNNQDQAEYNKLIQEGIDLAERLGATAEKVAFENMPKALNASNAHLQNIINKVQDLRKEWREFNSDAGKAAQSFIHIIEQITNTYKGLQLATKAFNGLVSISQKLESHIHRSNDLSLKELRALKDKAETRSDELTIASRIIAANKAELELAFQNGTITNKQLSALDKIYDNEKLINDELNEINSARQALLDSLDDEIAKEEIINKKLGVTGAIIKGLGKIPIIGDALDTERALKSMKDELHAVDENGKRTGTTFSAMKKGLGSIKDDLKDIAKDPFVILSSLGTLFLKTLADVDAQTGELAKKFNLSYKEASALRSELLEIANETGDINVELKGLQESAVAFGTALASNAVLNAKDLVTMTKLREQAGLQNDELIEMQKLTLATGQNLESNVKNMLYAAKTTALNNGVLLNEKQLMIEIAKTSNATKLSLGGSSENLGKAVAQAKALGMSLEQVDKIAESLLNFESSITSELEAELLIGKELNLEQARLYAINNDMEGLSKEIAKNFGSVAEFSKMNRIQQEAAAKAVGMSREELASTLTDQAALNGLSGEAAKQAKLALDDARKRGMTEEEIKDKGLEGLMAQQSLQERLNKSVEKLQELFVQLAEPLMPVLDTLAAVLDTVGWIVKGVGSIFDMFGHIGSSISKLLGPLGTMGTVLKGAAGIAIILAAYKAYASLATIPIAGVPLGIAAAAAVTAAGFGMLNKIKTANDMVSAPPGFGKRTLHGPEGAIALNDKDTVIAGTNLFDSKQQNLNKAKEQSINPESKQVIEVKQEVPNETRISDVRKEKEIIKQQAEDAKATSANSVVSSGSSIDITPLINKMASMEAILSKILEKEGNVYMDSTKVGTAMNIGTSKIQ